MGDKIAPLAITAGIGVAMFIGGKMIGTKSIIGDLLEDVGGAMTGVSGFFLLSGLISFLME